MDTGELARRFRQFARRECGASPLYRRLAEGIADAPDLLALAATGDAGPKPNLFLAAVHASCAEPFARPCRMPW